MSLANSPSVTRWTCLVVSALVANLAACDSSTPSPADAAAADTPAADRTTPPDSAPPADAGDVPQPPPDMVPPTDGGGDVPADAPVGPTMRTRPIVSCGSVCTRPLDAIPDSRGANVYFTAFAADGRPGVFRAAVPAEGMPPATPTAVMVSDSFEFPVGIAISNDDATLYVADQTATRGMEVGIGAVFSLPAAGGMPTVVSVGDVLVHPVSITVSADGNELLVAGQERVTMDMNIDLQRALFRVPRAGGTAMRVTNDLVDPSGVSQTASGTILCHDTRRGGTRSATAVSINAMGAVTNFAGGLVANYPAGLSHSMDGSRVLFSGADPTVGPGLLTLAGGAAPMATSDLSAGMERPLGLHRARMADAWAVADEAAAESGQVFMVTMR